MEFLSVYSDAFELYKSEHLVYEQPENLYNPVAYIMGLPAKRVRPILVLLSAESFGISKDLAMDAALAVEVFHNFTLVHDDIMDVAPLRRGHPTVHEKFNLNTAILSGDVMLIKSFEWLTKYPADTSHRLVKIFTQMAIEVCEGQQMDVDFESREDVTILDYFKMIQNKTSVLLAAALQMGAHIAGASEQDAYHIYHYGINIGIAFQIQDDLLDTFGTPKLGKQVAGDIIQNKKTYLYLKAMELGSKKEREVLKNWYSITPEEPSQKIKEVMKIFNSTHVTSYAEEVKGAYKDLALSHLEMISFGDSKRKIFRKFADYLLERRL